MFVTNWISPTKIQKISEITNFFRHYFLSRTEVNSGFFRLFRTYPLVVLPHTQKKESLDLNQATPSCILVS